MHLVLWCAASGADVNYFNANNFSHWDSGLYLSIATRGYRLVRCGDQPQLGWHSTEWCGNAGWLPGYPFVVRLLLHLGRLKPVTAGLIVSSTFYLAVLIAVWNWFFAANPTRFNLLSFTLAAFFPGNVYYTAAFPVSMFLFFTILCIHEFLQQRYAFCGIAGGIAASTYSTGFLLAPVVAASVLCCRRDAPLAKRIRWIVYSAGLICVGFASTLLVFHYSVGHWNAFFLEQKRYGHGIHNPFTTFLAQLQPFTRGWISPPQGLSPVSGFQSLFVLSLILICLIYFSRTRLRSELDCFAVLYLGTFWLAPLIIGGTLSFYRAESLLLPAAVLARRVPTIALAILVGIAVVLTVGMGALFFRNWLV